MLARSTFDFRTVSSWSHLDISCHYIHTCSPGPTSVKEIPQRPRNSEVLGRTVGLRSNYRQESACGNGTRSIISLCPAKRRVRIKTNHAANANAAQRNP